MAGSLNATLHVNLRFQERNRRPAEADSLICRRGGRKVGGDIRAAGRLVQLARTHGSHQVAQKSSSTYLPRKSARLTVLPSKLLATNAGAGSPFSRCRWA